MAVFLNGFVVNGLWYAFVLVLLSYRVDSEPTQDKQALLAFLSQTPHKNRRQWNASDSACNWVGVGCDVNRSFVYSLRLPDVGLVGDIPANTLGRLTQLRIPSLRSNRLFGQIPSDFSNLKLLRSFCLQRNHFPPHYHSISDDNLPTELFPQYTTIEYESPSEKSNVPPVFLFVVDTCMIEEEIGFLKSALSQAVGLVPENSLVGLITFGTYVYVHELGFGQISKVYVFKGSKDAYKKRRLKLPAEREVLGVLYDPPPLTRTIVTKLPLTNQFRFLNKAAALCSNKI